MLSKIVVYIEWFDSHGGEGQYSLEYAVKSKPDTVATAGILIAEDDLEIKVVQDIFRLDTDNPQVREYVGIPKVNITRIERWVVPTYAPISQVYSEGVATGVANA